MCALDYLSDPVALLQFRICNGNILVSIHNEKYLSDLSKIIRYYNQE